MLADNGKSDKEILVLNSINFNLPWAKNFYWYVHDVLQEQGITARAESLSVPALQDTMEVNAVIEHLRQKYPLPPAAIVIIGDPGWIVCRPLFDDLWKDVPVIMVTAKEAEFDKVKGLEGGADDYITKPFGMMEFIARVKAVLRRSARQNEDRELHYGELYLNVGRHEVRYQEEKIELTRKEFELLQYLMENKSLVMTRNQILCHVWGYDFDGETRTVDVHVRTLRQKLGEAGDLIETVRGVGYRIGE